LLGGAWLTHLLADLGDGRFDGAWLVQNFETLKPESAWDKYASLFARVDEERERFLDFERWWNGWYFLSREEMLAIIENLFIGNQLEEGKLRICHCCFVDLKRIKNPLVIFASYGDNITPPHQALGWIAKVYKSTSALKEAKQRIVYLTNPHVGHLGIFVSASVARLEHRAILDSLASIEKLAPGLYEMKIDNPTGEPDCGEEAYKVRFEERRVEDLRFPIDYAAFERVRTVSEWNEALYSMTLSPWIKALSTPASAAMLEALHPMRTSRLFFATAYNPWMRPITEMAAAIQKERHPVGKDNPFKALEASTLQAAHDGILALRLLRDAFQERIFLALFGSSGRILNKERHGHA
jgi:hypothetical protein